MICRADTVGVFQIESRAQMSMLPRLRPRDFYDLVIEVAIVRPGPIQGGMVHPYLRRREGTEKVTYPSPEVEEVLSRTLGVPLFQEQAMQLAIVAAGFTPDEADGLRRSMAAWKRKGDAIYRYGRKLVEGMIANGYPEAFAHQCFEQIKGFSQYGFPESHAASFALLVYVSSWLKCHHPAAFAAALINSQPMGFYAPAQIVRDAKEHGVEVRGIDVNWSGWECGLEVGSDGATERRSDEGMGEGTEARRHEGTEGVACEHHVALEGRYPAPAVTRRSGGHYVSFISWPFQRENTPLGRVKDWGTLPGDEGAFPGDVVARLDGSGTKDLHAEFGRRVRMAGATEYLRTQAVSRLFLDNIYSIGSSWVTMGPHIGQVALHYGANDMGSVMMEENVVSSAGTTYCLDEPVLNRLIRDAGFLPAQRDNTYDILKVNDGADSPDLRVSDWSKHRARRLHQQKPAEAKAELTVAGK